MNLTKAALVVATIASATAVVAFSALLWVAYTVDEPWDPLGQYPVQRVDEVTDHQITTTGTKCNTAVESVRIVGEFNWFRVIPPGFGSVPTNGTRVIDPGCTTETFTNEIPQAVLDVNTLDDMWYITGTEWPVDAHGKRGVPRTWFTENFAIPTT